MLAPLANAQKIGGDVAPRRPRGRKDSVGPVQWFERMLVTALGNRTMPEPEATIYVEPWPAGGWVVRVEGHPVPVSRHDTQDEAEFRASVYRNVLERGHRLAFDVGEHGETR